MSSAFVGRTRELELLRSRLDSALAGRGGVVFLSADPGAGKTTLTSRFLDIVADEHPDVLIIRAGCSEQYGAGEPYQPFVEAFRFLTHERERDQRRGRSFRELARQLAPYWVAAIPVAGEVLAASWHTASELKQQFAGGGSQSAPSEEAFFFQYSELFFAAAAEAPVVLFLDDLHWADRATIALLTHLARRLGDQRVLVLGTYRPAELNTSQHPMRQAVQELERYRVAEELALQPLERQALADLVLLHTGAAPSAELFEWLERRAGTNALFFEELLRWLVSQEFTRDNLGELQLARLPRDIEIPRSAESTIEKRLDRLDEATRRILEYASVQGDEFDSVSLSRLLDADELELEEALDPIARVHGLVQMQGTQDLPNGDVASVYRFAHSLIQDVLHSRLQGKRRILLHRRMAQILEETHGADSVTAAPRLALHFDEGRQSDKAHEYAITAAARASRLYAHWDALEQLQRALRNAADPERKILVLERLGDEYDSIGRTDEAVDSFDEALALLPATASADRLRVRRKRAKVEAAVGSLPLDELLPRLDALRREAAELQQHAEECRIIWEMIVLPGTTESMDVGLARDALQIAQGVGDPVLLARGHEVLGLALTFGGDPAAAMIDMQTAAALYAQLGDRGREAACRSNLSLARVLLGDYTTAAAEFEAATGIFDEIADSMRAASTRSNLGALLRIIGRYEDAEARLLESIRIFGRLGAPVSMLSPLMNLAELHEARGEWNDAEMRWLQMLHSATDTGYTGEQVIAHCGIGTARLRLKNLSGAVAAERAARALVSSDPDSLTESAEALQLFSARLAAAAGEAEGAIHMLERLEASVRTRDRYLAAVYRLERAMILHTIGSSNARSVAEQARAEFHALGAAPDVHRADALIARSPAVDSEMPYSLS
ncbi:MAG TPA: AAA family ATPase [Longimicrobiales bacterium]|nr:AAA family ATPase [Longimicrobiales bacterium]